MKNTSLALVAGLALMACSPSTEPTPVTPAESVATAPSTPEPAPPVTPAVDPAADTCGLAQYVALVGKPATDPAVPTAGPSVRHIKPDSQVTMDFSPARLNIDINAEGVITGFRCG